MPMTDEEKLRRHYHQLDADMEEAERVTKRLIELAAGLEQVRSDVAERRAEINRLHRAMAAEYEATRVAQAGRARRRGTDQADAHAVAITPGSMDDDPLADSAE